jgi:hypothetical protein
MRGTLFYVDKSEHSENNVNQWIDEFN